MKWDRVLEGLWKKSRFTSYFYQSVRFVEDGALPTLALAVWSRRATLFYNADFIETMTEEELTGLLVHEMLHVVFKHDHRAIKDENPHLQNLAQDMVINSYMRENELRFFSRKGLSEREVPRLVLPAGLPVIPPDFFEDTGEADPTWERVYTWLKRRGPKELADFTEGLKENFEPGSDNKAGDRQSSSVGTPDLGDGEQVEKDESFRGMETFSLRDSSGSNLPTGTHVVDQHAQRKHLEANMKQVLPLAEKDDTSAAERFYQEICTIIKGARKVETAGWINRIRSIVDTGSSSNEWEFSSSRFNRRYFSQGIYAAGRKFRENKIVTVVVDVSASMITRPENIEAAFGAVEALLDTYRVNLVCIDENLFIPEKRGESFIPGRGSTEKHFFYKKGDWKYIRTGNSGTTFFAPLFNDYLKNRRETVIVISDGEIYDMDMLKPYPATIWLIPAGGRIDFTPPFGQAFHLETMDER